MRVDVAWESEHAFRDDVALDLGGAATYRKRAGKQKSPVPTFDGGAQGTRGVEQSMGSGQVLGQLGDPLTELV